MTTMLSALGSRLTVPTLVFAVAASGFLLSTPARGDVRGCHCESLTPAEMEKQRECSLCLEANKQPAYVDVFFLKDANPTKPNRLLVLPKAHTPGSHSLASLSPEARHLLWTTAIAKAQEVWGDGWAIAYNGDERRTQCHTHLHIGKLLPDQEGGQPLVVNGPIDIPAPKDGTGLWVHPVDGKLHVHLGQQVNETVLMR
jgi:diadenosine tetraphosphate (Ap4A) HIT family hydrolase